MPNAKIDQNHKGTWTAYNETTRMIENAQCDPVTGALLVFVVERDANVPEALNAAKIDGNNKGTETGWSDETKSIEAFRCGNDGSLLVYTMS